MFFNETVEIFSFIGMLMIVINGIVIFIKNYQEKDEKILLQ